MKLSKRLSMGKNPMDYNKLRELGMEVLTESWVHPYIKIVQNLHLLLIGKEILYI